MAQQAQTATGRKDLEIVADRGYFKGEEILACQSAGMTPLVPKPLTSSSKAEGRFGKQDFVYLAGDDTYRCPAGERLTSRYASVEDGMTLHVYWTSACPNCPLKAKCTTGKERRIKAWMGSTHFLTKTLRRVSTEMSLHVLAYNLKRVMKVLGVVPLMQAMRT